MGRVLFWCAVSVFVCPIILSFLIALFSSRSSPAGSGSKLRAKAKHGAASKNVDGSKLQNRPPTTTLQVPVGAADVEHPVRGSCCQSINA